MADAKKNKYYVDENAEAKINEMMYKAAMAKKKNAGKTTKTTGKKK